MIRLVKVFTGWNSFWTWPIGVASMVVKSLVELVFAFTDILNEAFSALEQIYDEAAFAVDVVEDLVCSLSLLTGKARCGCNLFAAKVTCSG